MKRKKGQGWGVDISIGLVIFSVAILIFYFFILNNSSEKDSELEKLENEAETFSEILLSEGYPINWDLENYKRIGLTNEKKINKTKLKYFQNLSEKDYNKVKSHFGLTSDFFINFSEEVIIDQIVIKEIGKIPKSEKNRISIQRYVLIENKPITMSVDLWK